ncbi:ABC transporter substrate-binding protein [Thiofilum flexile]|uniref:ABC transporter substrate-binding protein n=1 Tax=Thiofilum flexile TaxID=125627 RepID=UPI00037BC10A|nr:ABC transporter substrate-binding protein [Thiofilum flexile]
MDNLPPEFDALYRAAQAEGEPLLVWAGGDAKSQSLAYTAQFEQLFPDIPITVTVDLSKYHDAELDKRLLFGEEIPDVIHIQTVQNFPIWANDGVLQRYRPLGFEQVPAHFVDPDGYWTPIGVFQFAPTTDYAQLPDAPIEYQDFLRPELKGKIVLTYPHDDDAVLYQFLQIIEQQGWSWFQHLMAQDIQWVRGTQTPLEVIKAGKAATTFTSYFPLVAPEGSSLKTTIPEHGYFQAWYQIGGILAEAKAPAAARLYLSYLLSKAHQNPAWTFPARTDVAPLEGFKPISHYSNASPAGFAAFMADRGQVERWRFIFESLIGPVEGVNPNTLDM